MFFKNQPLAPALLAAVALGLSACGQDGGYAGGIRERASFVYVTDQGADSISIFQVLLGQNLVPVNEIDSGGTGPNAIVSHPTAPYVYVLNTGSSSVSAFAVDLATGNLSATAQASILSGCNGFDIDPGGFTLFLACGVKIASLDIGGDGASLSNLRPNTAPAVDSLKVDPSGRFLYAASSTGDSLSSFSISGSGTLSLINTVSVGTTPDAVAVDPIGTFVMTANRSSQDSSLVPTSSGTLGTAISVPAQETGSNPSGVTISPTGDFVYVMDRNNDVIEAYSVQPGPTLLALTTYATDQFPVTLTFSQDGAFAIATNSGNSADIYLYTTGSSGVLAFSSQGAADLVPSGAAIVQVLQPAKF